MLAHCLRLICGTGSVRLPNLVSPGSRPATGRLTSPRIARSAVGRPTPEQPRSITDTTQEETAVAKQMVFSDDARQPLLAGVAKLARAVRSTLGPRGRNAVLDKGWGSPEGDQGRRHRRRRHRTRRSVRKPRRAARQGSRQQDERRRRRRHDDRHGAGRSDLPRRPEDDRRRGRSDGPLARHRTRPSKPSSKQIKKMATPINEKNKKRNRADRHDRRQQRPDDRRRAGRRLPEGRQRRRDHGRRRQAIRDDRRSRRRHAVRSRLPLAALRHQSRRPDRRTRKLPHPDLRRKDLERQEPGAAARSGQQGEQAAVDHRRRRRRRSPGDARRQQDARHSRTSVP